jgi:hypothetical protein
MRSERGHVQVPEKLHSYVVPPQGQVTAFSVFGFSGRRGQDVCG